jgi:hypothetical protein
LCFRSYKFKSLGLCLFITTGSLNHSTLSGHELSQDDRPTFSALKVDAQLTVDGVLDEPFWQDTDIATNFIDRRTQQLASQQTKVRVAYGPEAIYVGVEALDDDMANLHASERREDRYPRADDFVQIHIEPSHIHRTKYGFFSNPLGTRVDGVEGFTGNSWTFGWSAEWDLAAKILEDRWVFEMRIPYGAINYNREDDLTWGFNVSRSNPSRDEFSWWSFNPTDSFRPHNFGHATEFHLADTRFERNLELSPYISSRADISGDGDTSFEAGLDASFRLSPSLIAALTLNPDFGQVEADADTIELLDTERFLPERRPFFSEGSELLRMPHLLYYTRRFTDIQAGAKLSGEYKDFNVAFLNIQGDTVHGSTREGNSSVFRAVQNIGTKSSMGYYLNNSDFKDGHSRVVSSDGFFFLNEDFRLGYQASLADDKIEGPSHSIIKDSSDYLGFVSLSWEKYPWEMHATYTAITDEFDPNLGLIFRRNIFGPTFATSYGHDSDQAWYKSLDVRFNTQYYQNDDGARVLEDYELSSNVVFHNDVGLNVGHRNEFHAPYDNHRTRAGITFDSTDFSKLTEVAWAGGEFRGTDYNEVILGKRYQPSARFPIRWEYVARFEDQPNGMEQTIWLNRIVADYFFTDDMWIKSSLQHQNNDVHNISLIYAWKIKPRLQWYLVFNSVSDRFETEDSVFSKLVYTFDQRKQKPSNY